MRSINKVILIGNLTRDPELKQTPGGQNIVTFGIATNREWATREGQKHSLTEYHDLVAWANLAEICKKYLKKGKLVYVEGYLKTRSWDLPDGTKKFRTEIVVQDLIMLDKRQGEGTEDFIPDEYPNNDIATEQPHQQPHKETEKKHVEEKPAVHEKRHAAAPKAPAEKPAEEAAKTPTSPAVIDIDQDLGL